MNRAAVILAVVSALCLGLALGFGGGIFFSHHMILRGQPFWPMGMHGGRMMHGPGHEGGMGRPFLGPPPARIVMPQLKRMLDLSPEQVDAIRAELEQTSDHMEVERDSLRARIVRHLTPAQRERFDRMLRDRHPGEFRGLRARPDRAEPGPERESTR